MSSTETLAEIAETGTLAPISPKKTHASTERSIGEIEAQSYIAAESTIASTKSWAKNPWKAHTRKIFLACGIVVMPMIAFTIAIIWVVFTNLINENRCPYPELCPGPDILNTSSKTYYYVDYPAARLVFISSWSSTVSLSFVSMQMTLFGYLIASRMLRASSADDQVKLPSPYQTSILMRVLNADILVLWDQGTRKLKKVFWASEQSSDSVDARSPQLVRASVMMFLFCLLGRYVSCLGVVALVLHDPKIWNEAKVLSVLVQAADTYLHIVTESANFVQIQSQESQNHLYSRGLAPWCLDRPRFGSANNVNYWGCGLFWDDNVGSMFLSNVTAFNNIEVSGPTTTDAIYNYTDSNGLQYALVGPYISTTQQDWIATTIGVSTQCSAVPPSGCTRAKDNSTGFASGRFQPFTCSKEKGAGFDIAGNISGFVHDIHYFDFHKYLRDPNPFSEDLLGWDDPIEVTKNVKDDEEVFKNPFMTLSRATIEVDRQNYPEALNDTNRLWVDPDSQFDYTMLVCNTTVWDIQYSAIAHEVTWLSATKSNGSVAGIASLPGVAAFMFLTQQYDRALQYASSSASSMQAFIDSYALSLAKIRSYSLATQMSPRPALLTQTRNAKVITKVPVAALWLLVIANALYALFGLGLAVMALVYTNPSVHQVYTRMSITGIVAQLFEREYAERAVDSEEMLFRENVDKEAEIKRVGVRRTDTGGSAFAIS